MLRNIIVINDDYLIVLVIIITIKKTYFTYGFEIFRINQACEAKFQLTFIVGGENAHGAHTSRFIVGIKKY